MALYCLAHPACTGHPLCLFANADPLYLTLRSQDESIRQNRILADNSFNLNIILLFSPRSSLIFIGLRKFRKWAKSLEGREGFQMSWQQRANYIIWRMGILGLLQYLKGCMKERRLSDYKGKTAAVDTYAWLHKIIKGPSGRELILGGPNRFRYVSDCLKRITKIQNLGVKVIMVFDGGPLPSKRGEEQSRRKRREETFAKGKEMLDQGDQAGYKKLVDSIDISPDIAYRLIVELKKRAVQYIVAPYEADAQLAYLSRQGFADLIITEDSDLIAFGAKKMLYKLDFSTMIGSELSLNEIVSSKEANFQWFTHCMFLTTCILSGCDYLNQINGIGIKTAQKSIGRVTTFRGFLGELGSKSNEVPHDYELNFMKAFLTFRFQRVYCPRRRACVELNDFAHLSKSLEQLQDEERATRQWSQEVVNLEVFEFMQFNSMQFQFLGEKYHDEIADKIANSEIHPVTLQQFDLNFAESLTYVPTAPMRVNSTLATIKHPAKTKSSTPFAHQSELMAKFLGPATNQKLDLFQFEYKSLKNKGNIFMGVEQPRKVNLPELKPAKGGLLFRQDQEDSDIEIVAHGDEESSVVESISASEQFEKELETRSCKNELQEIAEKLFGQIFSQEYLNSPFSF